MEQACQEFKVYYWAQLRTRVRDNYNKQKQKKTDGEKETGEGKKYLADKSEENYREYKERRKN